MSNKIAVTQNALSTLDQSSQNCENCHRPVDGMYCSHCGQSIESTLKYFWLVILHLLDDVFSFDSRASRTLFPLAFKPGFLTNEYIAGRRVHYVPPLRLYLFVSISFFISLKFLTISEGSGVLNIGDVQSNLQQINQQVELLNKQKNVATLDALGNIERQLEKFTTLKSDLSGNSNLLLKGMTSELATLELLKVTSDEPLSGKQKQSIEKLQAEINKLKSGESITLPGNGFSISNNKDGTLTFDFLSDENNTKLTEFSALLIKKAEKAITQDSAPVIQEIIEKLPQLMFILLPLFAVLLKLMFVFSNRLYLEHLTVALHSHSFIFISILLIELLSYVQSNVVMLYPGIGGLLKNLSVISAGWIPVYLFIMQKRVYKQSYFVTFVKYAFIGVSYIFMIVLTGLIAFVWGLAST